MQHDRPHCRSFRFKTNATVTGLLFGLSALTKTGYGEKRDAEVEDDYGTERRTAKSNDSGK